MSTLSDSDRYAITARIRELRRTGNPMEANQLIAALNEDRHPPANLMGDRNFKPEKDIAVPLQDLEVPPRAGRGASKTKWAEFALTVADIEPQVINALDRDEIIELLEARGIIGDGEGEGSFETADGDPVEPTDEETEPTAPEVSYDPSDHNVGDVLEYAATVTTAGSIESLMAMESNGKNRSSLMDGLTKRLEAINEEGGE